MILLKLWLIQTNCLFKGFIDYEEFKKYIDNKSIVYLDVRNRNELKNDGVIPGCVNIPRKNLQMCKSNLLNLKS